ncbi:MAG: hypothetical protein F6K41_05890 [Symploca sp. SIO3E6]|nr:hypothetical protein [Caldora sp. SIO3E6]
MPKSFKVVASAIALTLLMVGLWLVNPTPAQADTKPCGKTFNLTETDPVCIKPWLLKGPISLRISCDVEPQTMIWFPGGNECFNVLHNFECDPQHGSYDIPSCFPKLGDNIPVRTTESPNGSIRIDFLNG